MCVPNGPLFQRCQVYDWPPFFNKKYMNDPIFLDSYVKGPIFLTPWYRHIIFAQRCFEAACSLGVQWTDWDITSSNKWVQKIKGQYMNRSTFWMIKYMNGSVFSKARYINGVGFEILARTPVPKILLLHPLPSRENWPRSTCSHWFGWPVKPQHKEIIADGNSEDAHYTGNFVLTNGFSVPMASFSGRQPSILFMFRKVQLSSRV